MIHGISVRLSTIESRLLTLHLDVFAAIFASLLLLVFLFIQIFGKRPWTQQLRYEDKDGVGASSPSTDWIPRLLALLAVSSALTTSVVENVGQFSNASWANTVAWSAILLLTLLSLTARSTTHKFNLGLIVLISILPIIVTDGWRLYLRYDTFQLWQGAGRHQDFSPYRIALALVAALSCVSIRRRPPLYRQGHPVDDECSTSLLSRLTFAWAADTLSHAWKAGRLEDKDLRLLSYDMTSASLSSSFAETKRRPAPLWLLIIRNHFRLFFRQSSVTLVHSFFMFGPTLALQRFLRILESRTAASDNAAIWWAVAMVTTIVLGGFSGAWESWINWGNLEICVRSQMYTLIFEKCLRLEDVKSPEGADEDDDNEDLAPSGEDEDDSKKTASKKKNIINMLGVDVDRVAAFAAENTQLTGCIFQFVIGMAFLASVIGWESTLAGLTVPILFFPIHRWTSLNYYNALAKMMKVRDQKSHVVTEVLHAIKQVKFSAGEDQWQGVIMKARQKEIDTQWTLFLFLIGMTFAWESTPIFLGVVSLTTYSLLNGSLPASTAFTAVSLLTTLQFTVSVIPVVITELIQARVSCRRIEEHLNMQEKKDYYTTGTALELKDATLAWSVDQETHDSFCLEKLNLRFPSQRLSIITGKTGSGKSLLLAGLVGEAALKSGRFLRPQRATEDTKYEENYPREWILEGTQAYVAQVPFLENASIRNNIVWGLPYDPERYKTVVGACAFASDIELFEDKDDTEIGATGVNLSGGQRWRLTLARALYSRAQILILDDIFSAVDTHVARHILEQAITGPIGKNRTIILATHHHELASSHASYIINVADGTATAQDVSPQSAERETTKELPKADSAPGDVGTTMLTSDVAKPPRKFVEDEARHQGSVKFSVYTAYISASGGWRMWVLILFSYVAATTMMLYRSYVVKQWTSQAATEEAPFPRVSIQSTNTKYLLLYIGVSLLTTLLVTFKILMLCIGALKASRKMFFDMTTTVLRAPMRWLERTPTGRLLNRFVGDFEEVDIGMLGDISWFMSDSFSLLNVLVAAMVVSVWMGLPILVLIILSILITVYFLPAAREVKRLDSVAKSPIFDLFNVALSGLATIRSFEKTGQYVNRMHELIDIFAAATWHQHLVTSWMTLRQGMLGATFVAAMLVLILVRNIDAPLAGFVLSIAMEFTDTLVTVVRTYSNLELDMNATERIVEYINLETESEKGIEPETDWPSQGRLTIKDLEVAYAADLPPVLKNIDLSIAPHERVGVVGRTGSGKSTLVLALFRFLLQRNGTIEIDGIDTANITLQSLRKRLSIIPQDPVLFTGTLRSNLDPFDRYTDAELKDVLRQVNLFSKDSLASGTTTPDSLDVAKTGFTSLDHQVSRGGLNMSQGQRQLVCLARAMLARPKIMLLDEATSAVDMETDALIQRSLRERFVESTLIVIAHRLSTVIDFDKILVMGDGRVLEFGSPDELYRHGGYFTKMVQGSGESERLIEEMSGKSNL